MNGLYLVVPRLLEGACRFLIKGHTKDQIVHGKQLPPKLVDVWTWGNSVSIHNTQRYNQAQYKMQKLKAQCFQISISKLTSECLGW